MLPLFRDMLSAVLPGAAQGAGCRVSGVGNHRFLSAPQAARAGGRRTLPWPRGTFTHRVRLSAFSLSGNEAGSSSCRCGVKWRAAHVFGPHLSYHLVSAHGRCAGVMNFTGARVIATSCGAHCSHSDSAPAGETAANKHRPRAIGIARP